MINGVKGLTHTHTREGGRRDGHLKPQERESLRLHKCLSSTSKQPMKTLKSIQAVIFVLRIAKTLMSTVLNLNCRPRGGNVQIISVTGPAGEVEF